MEILVSDQSYNSYNIRVLTAGGDFSRFKKNPIMLFNHQKAGRNGGRLTLPPGTWQDLSVRGEEIYATPVFDEGDDDAMQLKGKYDRKVMRAASLGLVPLSVVQDEDDEFGNKRFTIDKWSLFEISVTDIPSNQNAVAFYNDQDERIELSAVLALAAPTPTTKILPTNMDLAKFAGLLGLSASASEAEITAKINAFLELQVENTKLVNENTRLLAESKVVRDEQIELLLSAAVDAKQITEADKPKYKEMLELNFNTTKSIIEGLAPRVNLSDIPKKEADVVGATAKFTYQGKTFSQLQKEDSAALLTLRAQDFDTFSRLYESEFGVSYKR